MIDYYGISGDWSPLPSFGGVVWSNGCYDILHLGHLELLSVCREESKKLPNSLVFVGLDSDARVRERKGKDRPINNQITRVSMLLSLRFVDGVFVYDTDEDLVDLLKSLTPAKMIIGDEYKNKIVLGSEHCNEVVFFPKIQEMSTSSIIEKIRRTL